MVTITTVKADVAQSSNPFPSPLQVMEQIRSELATATKDGLLNDFDITCDEQNLSLKLIHSRGSDSPEIHQLAHDTVDAIHRQSILTIPVPSLQELEYNALRHSLTSEEVVMEGSEVISHRKSRLGPRRRVLL